MLRFGLAFPLGVLLAVGSCRSPQRSAETGEPTSYALGTIGGFGELVNSGVKKLALSEVLPPAELDRMLPQAQRVAAAVP